MGLSWQELHSWTGSLCFFAGVRVSPTSAVSNLPVQEAENSEDADMSGEGSNSDVEQDSDNEGSPQRRRLPTWRPVALDSAAGAAPSCARAPQLHILANPAPDTSCLQLDGGLCATGDSGADGQVHLWSTEGDELELQRSLAGHTQGVATLSFQVGGQRSRVVTAWQGQVERRWAGRHLKVLVAQRHGDVAAL